MRQTSLLLLCDSFIWTRYRVLTVHHVLSEEANLTSSAQLIEFTTVGLNELKSSEYMLKTRYVLGVFVK